MTNKTESIEDLLRIQDEFSSLFYNKSDMSPKQKEEMLKTLTLAMHSDIAEIVSSCNFKVFDKTNYNVNKDKIVYNSIDVFRYLLAILNLYDIKASEFMNSFKERDIQLKIENNITQPKSDQKVIVVDIDDVVCDFRNYFNEWLYKTYNIKIDPNSTSYYSSKEVKDHGYSPEGVFENFIASNELLNIPAIDRMIEVLKQAKKKNMYIQLLTSRPGENLKCKYQTYSWLYDNNVPFDNIGFASEKYIWVAKKDFYLNGNLVVAIDDSPKHAMEYATHDINVIVPKTHYNKDIKHKNIMHVTSDKIKELSF
tara:strand:+ start:511 stop:1440 length:930 start_codon:yes stop_codon:yes gene_type:complete